MHIIEYNSHKVYQREVVLIGIPRIDDAIDMDPCLILAGTSLKVIERLQQLGWKRGGYLALSAGVCIESKFVKGITG